MATVTIMMMMLLLMMMIIIIITVTIIMVVVVAWVVVQVVAATQITTVLRRQRRCCAAQVVAQRELVIEQFRLIIAETVARLSHIVACCQTPEVGSVRFGQKVAAIRRLSVVVALDEALVVAERRVAASRYGIGRIVERQNGAWTGSSAQALLQMRPGCANWLQVRQVTVAHADRWLLPLPLLLLAAL